MGTEKTRSAREIGQIGNGFMCHFRVNRISKVKISMEVSEEFIVGVHQGSLDTR